MCLRPHLPASLTSELLQELRVRAPRDHAAIAFISARVHPDSLNIRRLDAKF